MEAHLLQALGVRPGQLREGVAAALDFLVQVLSEGMMVDVTGHGLVKRTKADPAMILQPECPPALG